MRYATGLFCGQNISPDDRGLVRRRFLASFPLYPCGRVFEAVGAWLKRRAAEHARRRALRCVGLMKVAAEGWRRSIHFLGKKRLSVSIPTRSRVHFLLQSVDVSPQSSRWRGFFSFWHLQHLVPNNPRRIAWARFSYLHMVLSVHLHAGSHTRARVYMSTAICRTLHLSLCVNTPTTSTGTLQRCLRYKSSLEVFLDAAPRSLTLIAKTVPRSLCARLGLVRIASFGFSLSRRYSGVYGHCMHHAGGCYE